MTPEMLNRLLQSFEAELPQFKHLDAPTAYAFLRYHVEGGQHWLVSVNPERREHMHFLQSLPPVDFTFIQPISLSGRSPQGR